jgi:hypothetical protein
MQPHTRRSLDGLLVIGPHSLDAQLRALTAYAARTARSLGICWTLLPGEDPSRDAPDSGFPIVVFDDEIAGFTPDEREPFSGDGGDRDGPSTDWHVAHATVQPKQPTLHLPVYGCAERGETPADAIVGIGAEPLDRQLARVEAFALRSAIRLRGVYVALDADRLEMLLQDFRAARGTLAGGLTLTVGAQGEIGVHA